MAFTVPRVFVRRPLELERLIVDGRCSFLSVTFSWTEVVPVISLEGKEDDAFTLELASKGDISVGGEEIGRESGTWII